MDLIYIQYLPGVGKRHFSVEDHGQVVAYRVGGAIFDVGGDDQSFPNEEIAVSGIRYFQKAAGFVFLDDLTGEIGVMKISRFVLRDAGYHG